MTSVEIERAFVGQILSNNAILAETTVEPHQFGDSFARRVFVAAREVAGRGETADLMTVMGQDRSLPPADLAATTTGAVGNWKFREAEIIRGYKLRQLRELSMELKDACENGGDPDGLREMAETTIGTVFKVSKKDRVYSLTTEVMRSVVDRLEERYKSNGDLPGITTGYRALDSKILGWEKRLLYYIGGRPSKGKSALGLNFAINAARRGHHVGIISLESSKEEIGQRLISNVCGIQAHRLKTGMFGPRDFSEMAQQLGVIQTWPIFVFDLPGATLFDVRSRIRRMVYENKVEIVFVDYLQLIQYGSERMTKAERVGEVSKAMKELARELDIPIVCLAQLKRDTDDRRPELGDFQHSSQIEQDADVAMLLHWEGQSVNGEIKAVNLLIEKGRDVGTGGVLLHFDGARVRFWEPKNEDLAA